MVPWTIEHRVFAYDSFVKNNECITAVQREFRRHFNIHRNQAVPARNTILRWVEALRTRGTLMNKRPPGAPRTARTPENVERVRQAMLRSPSRSARKHSLELALSNRTVRRILHLDLHFHPYKSAIVQQLERGDYAARLKFAHEMEAIIEYKKKSHRRGSRRRRERSMAAQGSPEGNGFCVPHIEGLRKVMWIKSSPDLSNENKEVGLLNIYKMLLNYDPKLKQWKFGIGGPGRDNKVVMMIGETGAGKTALINALVNCIFGIQWKYDCRIQLVGEHPLGQARDSCQRAKLMVYQINHQSEFCIPFSLTIIDTPELPETRGVSPDRRAIQQIRELFYNSELDHIDAICFVVQSSMTDLSLTQTYTFDSLLAMFGSSVQKNIVTFMTSANDDQNPQIPATIICARVPGAKDRNGCPIHFVFNDKVMYANNSLDDITTNEQHWSSVMENLKNFFTFLSGTSQSKIILPKNSLMQSNATEITVEALVHRIEEVMSKQYELEQTEKILTQHRVEIEKNEYFEYEVTKPIKKKIETLKNCTNCRECNSTCHHDCFVAYNAIVRLCEVFYFSATCKVCEHGSSEHFSEKFLWQNLVINQRATYRSLKMKYQRDDQEVLTYQTVLERLRAETEQLGENGAKLIKRATEHVRQCTTVRSEDEFVEQLIESEQHTRNCGFQGRIEMLRRAQNRIRRR
ncbi:uncharacterized protein [Dendrobates tinctorius]|uniref:uncharacterized protein isoform X2 n=1 Tax=Dendrobates tinctorius TaxID=92724 RepID=UPI003CC94FD7